MRPVLVALPLAFLLASAGQTAGACAIRAGAGIAFPPFTYTRAPTVRVAQGFLSVGDCASGRLPASVTLAITGANRAGGVDQMRRLGAPPGDGARLPYRASLDTTRLSPPPGPGGWRLVRLTARYDEVDALDLPAGLYSDRLIVSVMP